MESNQSELILSHKRDRYDAATFDHTNLPENTEEFDKKLTATLIMFRETKVRGVWLRFDLKYSHLIAIAVKHGFIYHHAKEDYVMMQHWLPTDQPNKLPHYTTHFIGVGGVVINEEKGEILVIQERVSVVDNMWKIPGGLVDEGEFLSDAAEREVIIVKSLIQYVFEETGVKAKFQSILAWRERTDYKWGQTDIYFACLLKPETLDINLDPSEIKSCKWMKFEEYLNLPNMYELQKRIAIAVGKSQVKFENIKNLGNDDLVSMFTFVPETYDTKIGDKLLKDNVFYAPKILKKVQIGEEKL